MPARQSSAEPRVLSTSPYRVYGMSQSYFTRKLTGYLDYKSISYLLPSLIISTVLASCRTTRSLRVPLSTAFSARRGNASSVRPRRQRPQKSGN